MYEQVWCIVFQVIEAVENIRLSGKSTQNTSPGYLLNVC